MKKCTFYSKIGVQIPKIAIFPISTLLGILKIHMLLDQMVMRYTFFFISNSVAKV